MPLPRLSTTARFGGIIAVAVAFLLAEMAVGFATRSLALVADAFHIMSDILGYAVALAAYRLRQRKTWPDRFTFGYAKAESLGGFFNGAVLLALGVSITLQSIERFTAPEEVTNPVLVMAIGAAGIGSNIVMLLFLGGHGHGHSHGGDSDSGHGHSHGHQSGSDAGHAADESNIDLVDLRHSEHAHTRSRKARPVKHSRFDSNTLGILLHIFGDAINSVAVIISAGIYKATGWRYADPLASLFVGAMVMGTAYPLLVRSAKDLLQVAPASVEMAGLLEDIERLTGKKTVHELHVWTAAAGTNLATLHVQIPHDSLERFQETISECMHLWGVHDVTVQPESAPAAADDEYVMPSTPIDANTSNKALARACVVSCVAGCKTRVTE
ncbi:hypothetical protein JCM10207_006093 [Rhodosporidiobolus poonsookiae]